jgi:hypothetical protein
MTFIFLSSFTFNNSNAFIGTYGVSDSSSSQIKLVINDDQTFYYQDFSNAENKIVVEGRWTLKGKNVILNCDDANVKFHDTWTFTNDGQVAKSRKGLCYYRICKLNWMEFL